ncbi:MAG TPA: head decoration protein [Oligoflexus sp.]|uniref:head decoration protein n=1 Tax=Oligoflexus sp. TaxID=1971216 RepID=UPI002D3C90E6|nr:head decoration protein [Oligoflexus sp.]HYX36939.1 head decoration protein [Oligoflexus sp.]
MFGDLDGFNPHDLIAGDFPLKTEAITLAKGQNLKRGSVLGRIKASGKFVLSRKTNDQGAAISDGSEIPLRILGEAVDASDKDQVTVAYRTGSFLKQGLTLHESHNFGDIKYDLETRSIFIED